MGVPSVNAITYVCHTVGCSQAGNRWEHTYIFYCYQLFSSSFSLCFDATSCLPLFQWAWFPERPEIITIVMDHGDAGQPDINFEKAAFDGILLAVLTYGECKIWETKQLWLKDKTRRPSDAIRPTFACPAYSSKTGQGVLVHRSIFGRNDYSGDYLDRWKDQIRRICLRQLFIREAWWPIERLGPERHSRSTCFASGQCDEWDKVRVVFVSTLLVNICSARLCRLGWDMLSWCDFFYSPRRGCSHVEN